MSTLSHHLPWSDIDACVDRSSDTVSTSPTGWTDDPRELLEHYYWTDESGSLKTLLKECYHLHDARPIWAALPYVGFIFDASPASSPDQRHYYAWNGMSDAVVHLKGKWTRDALRVQLNLHGGYLERLDMEQVLPNYDGYSRYARNTYGSVV